jgi:UPF0271 protein
VPTQTLTNDLLYQMGALEGFARAAGTRVSYVRAHGALYNVSAKDIDHASAIIEAVRLYNPQLPLLCQVGTATWNLAAESGITTIAEAFVDRAYTNEGLLVPRDQPDAMVTDPDLAAKRAVTMITDEQVTSVDGSVVPLHARALLIHSDTPGAVAIARATRAALESADIELVPLP